MAPTLGSKASHISFHGLSSFRRPHCLHVWSDTASVALLFSLLLKQDGDPSSDSITQGHRKRCEKAREPREHLKGEEQKLFYSTWGKCLLETHNFPRNWEKIVGIPGDSVVKKPLANAEDMGLIHSLGRPHIWSNQAHAPWLLSLCSRAWKLQLPSPHAKTTEARVPHSPCSCSKRRNRNEKPVHGN